MAGLQDRVVLITGASSGLGEGIALRLAADGCRLSLVGRNAERLEQTAKGCKGNGLKEEQIFTIQADLCNEEDVKRIVHSTLAKFGQINVLIHSAAVSGHHSLTSTHLMSNYDLMVKNNVRPTLQLTQLVVPHLLAAKGCILNIISINARVVMPNMIPTSMTKSALEQFTKVLALELGPKGVRVNGIHPGCVMTPILRFLSPTSDDTQIRERLSTFHPIGRIGEVEEVASLARFLVSDDASFVNGEIVCCDGGCQNFCPPVACH